jgi:putative alpha-1,2-mannosidase
MAKWLAVGFLVCAAAWTVCGVRVDDVDPFIGTVAESGDAAFGGHGLGKTFPGAAYPFGMVQLSPDTVTGGDNGPGYSWTHKTIEGFSFLHMSGIGWYGEFGNFQVMPGGPGATPFSHDKEKASPGYYAVELPERGCKVELTVSRRSGMMRITYAEGGEKELSIDLARRIGERTRAKPHGRQTFEVTGANAFAGEIVCDHRDGGWGGGAGGVDYTLSFRGAFSKPLDRVEHAGGETNRVVTVRFRVAAGESVTLHVAFAFDGRPEEPRGLDFDALRAATRETWAKALGCIDVEGGTPDERTVFATALYHAMIDPRDIGDAVLNGHRYTRRTVFSGWDVFRSAFPLLTLIRPDVVSDTVNSMMDTVVSGRRETLPRWDILGCPSGCMLGQPIASVMADAYEKGIRGFDADLALTLLMDTLEKESNDRATGYSAGSLSATLEYAYSDWCCGRLAQLMGKDDVARRYFGYAQNYTNCWSGEVRWMRTRLAGGAWHDWSGREVFGQGCLESNPWQQGWFVPHDPEGLMRLMGGRSVYTAELESIFAAVPTNFLWNAAYNHPNEPCHTLPFMWTFSDRPEMTGVWTRRICAAAYGTGPYGLCGNDDVGQMSAWYVLCAVGLHPLCPGDGRWCLTAPVFTRATLRLGNGKTFTIRAPRADAAHDKIRRVRLNGRPVDVRTVSTAAVLAGGELEIDLEP